MISKFDVYILLSYLPKIAEANIQWLPYDEDMNLGQEATDEPYWIDRGVSAFREAMEQQLIGIPENATHVVPLSSGLDSRAILGWLTEHLPKQEIYTVTYGIPGAWDYEISKKVAREAGVRHEEIDLINNSWDLDHLIMTGACLEHPASVFEAHVHRKICEYFGTSCIFWSGFLAGSLAGVHLPPVPSTGKEEATRRFLKNNRTPHFKDHLFEEEMIQKILDEYPWEENLYQTKMGLDQQLDYGIRHRYYIRSVLLVPGFNYKAPFISKPWLSYILNVPYRWLYKESMYKKVLLKSFPKMYRLPVRNNAGLPLSASRARFFISKGLAKIKPHLFPKDPFRSHPRTNYINFTESLRNKTKFQDLAYSQIQDLKERDLYSKEDLDSWWNDHLSRKVNNTVLLLNLASLEILLKSGNI